MISPPPLSSTQMATQATPVKPAETEQKRFRAVHGRIQNPFTLDWFDTENSKKVEVDSWIKIQEEAGKLVEDK